MKYRMLLLALILMMFIPVNAKALNINSSGVSIQILDKCSEDSTAILGDINNEESTAYLLQKILNYIKIIAPTLVIILSSIDYISVIVNSNEDAMKKAHKRLINRLLAAGLLFFIPLIVQVLLSLFGFTSDITCNFS